MRTIITLHSATRIPGAVYYRYLVIFDPAGNAREGMMRWHTVFNLFSQ